MKFRKSISILLTVLVLAGIAAVAPVTASAVKSGDFEYEIVNNSAVITKYTGSQTGHFVVPSTLDGYPVTEIGGDNVFRLQGFTSVTFPSTLKKIGPGAFSNCSELTSVIIPDSVTVVDDFAFSGCKKVSYLKLSNNTQSIGYRAFVANHSLMSVTIPKSVSFIDKEAFGYDIDIYGRFIKRTFEYLTVYGYKDTAGEQYCKDNSFTFIYLDNVGSNTNSKKTVKIANPIKVTSKKTVTAKAKKKTVIKKAVIVKKAKGKVSYKTDNKKVTVKKGKMIVAKGLKKGKTYTVKVKVTAKGNSQYKKKTKTVKIKVKVK